MPRDVYWLLYTYANHQYLLTPEKYPPKSKKTAIWCPIIARINEYKYQCSYHDDDELRQASVVTKEQAPRSQPA